MKLRSINWRSGQPSKKRAVSDAFTRRGRRRKSWTFEHLESRHYFSASPIAPVEAYSFSSNTAEGLQAILDQELAWSIAQSASQQGLDVRALQLFSVPTDPYFQYQWHLVNTGQVVGSPNYQPIVATPGEDINVLPAWDLGYTGNGVVIAVVDSGVQTSHPDLLANILAGLQYDAIDLDTDANPDLLDPVNAHGTAVAGLIGAVANSIGTVGVAYGAQIVPIRLVDPLGVITDQNVIDALTYSNQIIDIYNNSWGPEDVGSRVITSLTPLEKFALSAGIRDGRGGLGSIYVFASGNDAGPQFTSGLFASLGDWDSASYNGYVNSRYTIGVGGIDHDGAYSNIDGSVTNYMEAGPAILVAAPTGSYPILISNDVLVGSGIWTTDLLGEDGYNSSPILNDLELDYSTDFFADTNYTSRFNGTSAAAPLVSGVIALMLEANPNLTWRDVQEILVRSARQAGQFETPTTGGGLTNGNSWSINPNSLFYNPDTYRPAIPAIPDDPGDPEADPPIPPIPGFPEFPSNGSNAREYPEPMVLTNVAGSGQTAILLNYDSYKPPRPELFSNGAGYTVSQGIGAYGDQFGYGHGVIDAELAVLLASQWTTKDQMLDPELTFTSFVLQPGLNIQAGATSSGRSGSLMVPGAIGGSAFINYYSEYLDQSPFSPYNGPSGSARGSYYSFEIPDFDPAGNSNAMSVETIEVSLDISGNADALDGMRISLISPNGTVSELNHYTDTLLGGSRQNPLISPTSFNPPGSITGGNSLVYTFTTNRNWGERYDAQVIIDPVTGRPFSDEQTTLDSGAMSFQPQPVFHGWELHIENYSNATFSLNGVEIAWHGQPIDVNSQRIQGSIGIDSGRFGVGEGDGFFNYDRYFQTIEDLDGDYVDLDGNRQPFIDENSNGIQDEGEALDPQIIDFNEVVRTADPNQEPFAANVTVKATRVSDGAVVAQFVTGADGNFYFDLVPDEYIISIEDPYGRATKDENELGVVGVGQLAHYQHEWHITPDWFYVPRVDNADPLDFRVLTDVSGTPLRYTYTKVFTDGTTASNTPIASGVNDINFLLEGSAAATVNGNVYADLTPSGTGDGVFNGDDVPVGGFTVYGDTNQSGAFEAAEDAYTITDASGNYSLSVDLEESAVIVVRAIAPGQGWESTGPVSGQYSLLLGPGKIESDRDFFFRPTGTGDPGGNTPGTIFGVVFSDANSNGSRQATEGGLSGLRVYHDINENGSWDANEPYGFSGANGAYVLAGITPGAVRLDIEVPEGLTLTSPSDGFQDVVLLSGGTLTNILFGVHSEAQSDWGDLAGYPTTLAENGARHAVVPGFQLGPNLDADLNGQPSANADGDDLGGVDDEDGVVVVSNGGLLQPGANTIRVTVNGVGGYLNAWFDFNNDGDWDDAGEQVFDDLHLNQGPNGTPGVHDLIVNAPIGMAGGAIAARFRWGSEGLSYVDADPNNLGEVEDYRLANALQPVLVYPAGDYDQSGLVDHADYELWKTLFGTSDLRADGNNDGLVNSADYTVWRNNMGAQAASGAGVMLAGGAGAEATGAATITTASVAAARLAAYSRAVAGLPLDVTSYQIDANADAVARLLAAGAVPVTIQVGNGTQTVYTFPGVGGYAPDTTSTVEYATTSSTPPTSTASTTDVTADSAGDDQSLVPPSFHKSWLASREFDGAHSFQAMHRANIEWRRETRRVDDLMTTELLESMWADYRPAGDHHVDCVPQLDDTDDTAVDADESASELALAALFAGDDLLNVL